VKTGIAPLAPKDDFVQAVRPLARVHEVRIVDRREPSGEIAVIGVTAPQLARAAGPGQFVMVVPPGGERVGVALGIYEAEGDRTSFMIVVCGPRTRDLAAMPIGSTLTLWGPLGHGFETERLGHDVGIVAGGVGIASLLLPAQELRARGARAHLYYGARTASALVEIEKFAAIGIESTLATDDGTLGHHGFATDPLAAAIGRHSALIACGPSGMLRTVGRMARAAGVPAALSLEETFACGVGACWGCVVPLDRLSAQAPGFPEPAAGERREYVHARICVEGPVFWAHELRW